MYTKTILTDDQIVHIIEGVAWPNEVVFNFGYEVGRAIEQAVLQSEQIQTWKRDAELFQFLLKEAWFQSAFDRFDPNDNGTQREFESECRRILSAAKE